MAFIDPDTGEPLGEKAAITPQFMDAVKQTESGGKAGAVSPKGAQGPYQLMPPTAKDLGVVNPFDEKEARKGAERYYNQLLTKYDGNVDKALAAYNWGQGNVDRKGLEAAPKETQDYIQRVKDNMIKGRQKSRPPISFIDPDTGKALEMGAPKVGAAPKVEEPSRATKKGEAEPWSPYIHQEAIKGLVGGIEQFPTALAQGPEHLLKELDNPKSTLFGGPSIAGTIWRSLPEGPKNFYRSIAGALSEDWNQRIGKIREALGPVGVGVPKTSTGEPSKAAEYAGKFAELGGATLAPSAGAIAKAERPLVSALFEAISVASSATTSVEARDWGKNMAGYFGIDPERGAAIGEVVGSMAGPMLAKIGVGAIDKAGGLAAGKLGMHGLSPEEQKAAAKGLSVKEIQEAIQAAPGALPEAAKTAELSKVIPGFKPDIARATDAPALVALKQTMMGERPETLARGAEEAGKLREAIAGFQESKFPAGKTPFTTPIQQRYNIQAQKLDEQIKGVDREIYAATQKLKQTGQAEVGNQLRSLRDEKFGLAMESARAKYSGAYAAADSKGIKVDMAPLGQRVKTILGDEATIWQDKPGVLGQILKRYGAEEKAVPPKSMAELMARQGEAAKAKPVSVEEFHSLYKRVNGEMGEAALAKDWDKYRALKNVSGVLKDQVGKLEGPQFGEFGQKFREANAFYANEIIPKFREGVGGRMDNSGRFGDITPDEKVFGSLIKSPSGLKQAMALYGEDQRAQGSLYKAFYDDFARSTVKNGQVDVGAARNYLRQNKETLDLVPDLKKQLQGRTEMTQRLVDRRKELIDERQKMDRGVLASTLKSPEPDLVVRKALGNPQQLDQLVQGVRANPEASKSLARTIATQVAQMPDAMKFLRENGYRIQPVMDSLGPNHYANIMTIAQAEEVVGRVRVPTSVTAPAIEDIGQSVLGTPVKNIISQFTGKIRPGEMYRNIYLGSRFFYKVKNEEVNKLREAALFNPDVAEVLAEAAKKPEAVTRKQAMDFSNNMFAHGVRVQVNATTSVKEPDDRRPIVPDVLGLNVRGKREAQKRREQPLPSYRDLLKGEE